MSLPAFLSLVEIKTKVASVIPFLTGTAFALYRGDQIKLLPLVLFLISMLCFDMFTTALNNRQDHRKATRREGYNYERHNAIVHYRLSPLYVNAVLVLLFTSAVISGLLLVAFTHWFVLVVGIVAFSAGLLYSAGPLPISATPLGEAASGIAMGFGIAFLAWWIHAPMDAIFALSFTSTGFILDVQWRPLIDIILISIPGICCIANIMLANNICDISDDYKNNRYTMPVVAGKPFAMLLYHALYVISFLSIPAAVLVGAAPWTVLAVLLTVPKVLSNLAVFRKLQSKKDTFVTSVVNNLIVCLPFAVLIALGAAVESLFF